MMKVIDLIHQLTAICNDKGLANADVYIDCGSDVFPAEKTEIASSNTSIDEWESCGKVIVITRG